MHLPVGHDQLYKEASLMKKEAQVYGYKNKYLEGNSTIRPFNKVTKYSRFYFRNYDLHSRRSLTRIINRASITIPGMKVRALEWKLTPTTESMVTS